MKEYKFSISKDMFTNANGVNNMVKYAMDQATGNNAWNKGELILVGLDYNYDKDNQEYNWTYKLATIDEI